MGLDEYLEQKRRNRVRRELRRTKPYLMGADLENEIDRTLGIADSGKLDWKLLVEDSRAPSDYPTPESIGKTELRQIASEYDLRAYQLYWAFQERVNKLKAAGRTKSDYLALLKEVAVKQAKKVFPEELKVVAATQYASNIIGKKVSREQVELLLLQNQL